jgi:hypothetical protein
VRLVVLRHSAHAYVCGFLLASTSALLAANVSTTGAASGSAQVSTALPPPASAGLTPTTPPEAVVERATITPWRPIFVGVDACEGSTATPRPVQMRAVRVRLSEPSVDFLVTPSNGKEPEECAGRTTSEFLVDYKCQVAINGSYFDPFAKAKGDGLDVRGLSMSRGDLYSPADWKMDAFMISRDHRRAWVEAWPIETARKAWNGLAGYRALLIHDRIAFDNDGRPINRLAHPRSVVGVTRDGAYVVMMVIDGRQPGYSEGATTIETVQWLRKLDVTDALNLDGGGSTALVIEGPDGQPVPLNRPCGPPAGGQRRVANHLGVFAKRQ